MALYVASTHPTVGSRRLISVHLSNDDVTEVCAAERPSAALASLILSLEGTDLALPIVNAVSSRTAWRLRGKNRRHGERGLTIVFTVNVAIARLSRLVAYVMSTTRIRPPQDSTPPIEGAPVSDNGLGLAQPVFT